MRSVSRAQVDSTRAYIWSKDWLPYEYGGSGNPGGDCSWFVCAAAAHVQGMTANKRYGSTESFNCPGRYGAAAAPEAQPLGLIHARSASDVPADAVLKIGFMHGGGGEYSHTAGTFDGLNFESRGMYNGRSGHVVGPQARAWNDVLFSDFWYLDARVGNTNPDDFPLPAGWFYGPLDGPEEFVSGEAGEPAYQIDGLKHLQTKLGIEPTGRWRDAKDAIVAVQRTDPNLLPDGTVGPKTWALIMRRNTTPPPPAPTGDTPMNVSDVQDIKDFIVAYVAPLISDVKDLRNEMVGARDNPNYPLGVQSYPGHPSLYDLRAGVPAEKSYHGTLLDFVREIDAKTEMLVNVVDRLASGERAA